MAFYSMLRKSANSLAPLAIRLTQLQRRYHSCIFTALNHSFQSQQPIVDRFYQKTLHFSTAVNSRKTSSDETFLRILEVVTDHAELSYEHPDGDGDEKPQDEEPPIGFPFEIEDTPGLQIVTLTREYDGELIKVNVHLPDFITGEEQEDEDDRDDPDPLISKSSIPLVVTVSKKGGPSLEFNCTASLNEIAIDSLALRNPDSEDELAYEGPDFCDLDENLQKAFHKYLEIRGIRPGISTNYMHEYMIYKDSRECIRWLKKLKSFVEA